MTLAQMTEHRRYSEAERRGRHIIQDVTNIGVAGRRTGVRVEGARRGSDGFENESAFFSPTTTVKKMNAYNDLPSAKDAASPSKDLGSYEDMDLVISTSTPVSNSKAIRLTSLGSAQDVPTTLRKRSEDPRSSPPRRSRSPTKSYLNSPAIRARRPSRQPSSPPKSILRSPVRPSGKMNIDFKIARKIDFARTTSSEDNEWSLLNEKKVQSVMEIYNKSPAARASPSIVRRRYSSAPPRVLEPDEADLEIMDEQPPTEHHRAGGDSPKIDLDLTQDYEVHVPERDTAGELDPAFNEYIHDRADIEEPEEATQGSVIKSTARSVNGILSPPLAQEDRDEELAPPPLDFEEADDIEIEDEGPEKDPESDDNIVDTHIATASPQHSPMAPTTEEAENEENNQPEPEMEPVEGHSKKAGARRSPSSEDEEADLNSEPMKKRGRPAKKQQHPAKNETIAKDKARSRKAPVLQRPAQADSPSRSRSRTGGRSRERSRCTVSPERKWREKVHHEHYPVDEEGPRKSQRFKHRPLKFWAGEKMVYGRGNPRKSLGGTVGLTLPEVKEIIHVDLTEPERPRRRTPAAAASRRTNNTKRNGYVKDESGSESEDDEDEVEEHIRVEALVRSFENPNEQIPKILAIPASAYEPRPVKDQDILFQKTISDEPHFASGVLDLPIGGYKPPKPSRHNTMFFLIFTGYVEIRINDITFKLRKGGQFTVPRGNFYEIRNIGKREARLFFSQCTDTLMNDLINRKAAEELQNTETTTTRESEKPTDRRKSRG